VVFVVPQPGAAAMTVAQMLTLASTGATPYEPEELARICAADILAERDRRRAVEEYRRNEPQQEDER
jgi:hypothetical protein